MPKKTKLTVVVNGTPVDIPVLKSTLLKDVKKEALAKSHNLGRPDSHWDMLTQEGKKLYDQDMAGDIPPGQELFISLKAGWGGALKQKQKEESK